MDITYNFVEKRNKMNAATEISENILKEKPLDLYDYILRGPFCDIYTELKKTHKDDY